MKKMLIGTLIGGIILGASLGYAFTSYVFNKPSDIKPNVNKTNIELEYQKVQKVNDAVDKGENGDIFLVDEVYVNKNVEIDHPLSGSGYHQHKEGDKVLIGKIQVQDDNGNINEYWDCLDCYDVQTLLESTY